MKRDIDTFLFKRYDFNNSFSYFKEYFCRTVSDVLQAEWSNAMTFTHKNIQKRSLSFKPLSFLPPLLVMALIFYFSGQNQLVSGNLSYPVTYDLVSWFNRVFSLKLSSGQLLHYIDLYHFAVRKLAHMAIFCALSMTLLLPLNAYKIRRPYPAAFFICVIYACLDEFHQHFSQGRTPSAADVLIDSIGALIGLFAVHLFSIVLRRFVLYTERKKALRRQT